MSLIPGGTFVVSANEAYNGNYVSAAIGIFAILPLGKLGEAVAARIAFKDGAEILIGKEARPGH